MKVKEKNLKAIELQDAEDYLTYMKMAEIRARRKIEKDGIDNPLEVIKISENENRIMRDKYREEVGINKFSEDDNAIFHYELKNKHHLTSKEIKAIEQEC